MQDDPQNGGLHTVLDMDEIKSNLQALEPGQPWAHYFDFGNGLETVDSSNEKYFKKAKGLGKIGRIILGQVPYAIRGGDLQGKRVLDIACGEGVHSALFSSMGAAEVVGLEGRDLYVNRANFIRDAFGLKNLKFVKGDVRNMLSLGLGTFDIVICSGILHHLQQEVFESFLNEVFILTGDTAFIYTHVSTDLSVKRHGLSGPIETASGSKGYLFREHGDDASEEERTKQVRASLDNTFSFWATEESLVKRLASVGFRSVNRLMLPHPFGWENASYRPILVCRR